MLDKNEVVSGVKYPRRWSRDIGYAIAALLVAAVAGGGWIAATGAVEFPSFAGSSAAVASKAPDANAGQDGDNSSTPDSDQTR